MHQTHWRGQLSYKNLQLHMDLFLQLICQIVVLWTAAYAKASWGIRKGLIPQRLLQIFLYLIREPVFPQPSLRQHMSASVFPYQ